MMRKILLFSLCILFASIAYTQCVTTVDFNTWQQGGQPGNGNWVVQGGGSQVHQTVNGNPTFFLSPFALMNVHVSGQFKSTDFDDDYMGFVFSFLNPMGATDSFDCWLYDWKQGQQGGAPSGMSLDRVKGVIPPAQYTNIFWNHQNTPEFTVVQNTFGGAGWQIFNNHSFDLFLTYTRATILVDGVQIFDWPDCYFPGRFGFYNLSQQDCYYSNFQYDLFADFSYPNQGICRGQSAAFDFVNPCVTTNLGQYQSLTWNFGDGTTIVNNNPTLANVNLTHTYATAGLFTATMTIVDFNGCSYTASHQVDVRNPIVLNPTIVQPLCNGGSNGSISLAPAGGFGGFTYSWNGGVNTTQNWPGRPAGTYTVTVTDGRCATTGQFTINQPTAVTAVVSHTDAHCGVNDGTATIVISGGTGPYYGTPIPSAVNWGPGHVGTSVSGLSAGTFIADFQDANGCSSLLQYSQTIASLPCGISSTIATTNVTCVGGNNGTATLTVTGGTAPANISWSNGMTGAAISGLVAGTYTYNYTDANPLHAFNGTITIQQPTVPMAISLAQVGISCPGSNDGQAIASVTSGGVAPYTYTWSGGHPNNPVATNLSPGTITITITDSKGCTASASVNVSGVPSLVASTITVKDSCYHSGQGSVTVHTTGGSPPYNFSWNNFATDTSNTNVIAGTYTVTVTDSKGCTVTSTGTVTGPVAPLSYTFVRTDVNCFGNTTGALVVSPTGGTPGYSFVWSPNVSSSSSATSLAAGIYNYTMTDTYGCTVVGGDTVRQPLAALTAVTSHTDVTCNGANNGSVTITVAGGTPAYTYLGNPIPAGANTLSNLPANTYAGNVVDSKGCTVPVSETIIQPAVLTLSETHVNVVCNGALTGSINLTPGGGTPNYTYLWNDASTLQNRTNLAAATYTVTLTDNHMCTASVSITITQPIALTVSETHVNILCNAGTTGSINLTPGGGTPGYTYLWNDANTLQNRTNLAAATYTVTVKDNSLCSVTASITITQPTALSVTTSHTNVTCNGANNGTVTVTIGGGTPPYSYLGNPIPAGTTTIPSLAPATYAGNVLDANGCSVAVSETITQPAVLTLSETHVNVVCNSALTGSINLTAGGGTPNYTYLWNDASTLQNRTNLAAATYTVTLTDNNLCTATSSITITQPALLTVSETHVNVLCNAATTGSINLTPGGGTPNYTYLWNDANTLQNRTALAAATYNVTVTDNVLCTVTATITITQPTALSVTTSHTDVTCNGANNGTVTVNISGGTPPYSYLGNPIPAGTTTIPALAPATYAGNVLDANGCSVAVSETITQPGPQSATVTGTNNPCFGATQGTAQAVFINATGVVGYSWTGGLTGANITNLAAGVYDVTCTDANLCTVTGSYTVSQPAAVNLTLVTVDAVCFSGNGSATATPNGGNAPFNYTWSSSPSTISTASLLAGNFTVTSTDANTCQQTAAGTINQPTAISVTETHVDVACFGNSTGSVTITTTGGTGPNYTYVWSPNVSATNSATAIAAANYSITVTDQAACTATITSLVSQPAAALSALAVAQNISCFGLVDGSVTVTAAGGTTNYSYTWNPNVSATNVANALSANTYSITVTDANLCTASASATVTEPTQIVLTTSKTDLLCYQVNTGVATVNANGGTPNYTYTWNPNVSSSNTASSLAAGNYNITVTDNSSCTASTLITLIEPTQLVSNPAHTDNTCFGNNNAVIAVNASGGTPAYTYQWNPNVSVTDSALNLVASNYSFTVTDNNACTVTQSVTILSPAVLDVIAVTTDANCFGDLNGTITTTATGGTNPYNFSITNDGINFVNLTSGQFTGLGASVYTVYVTDANACVDSTVSIVNEPAQITDIVLAKDVTCYHYTNGQLNFIAAGGVPGYTFSLSDGSQNSSGVFTSLIAGVYYVTITDSHNCTIADAGTIVEPDSVQIIVTPDPVEVKLGESLQLQTSNNQTGNITYNWQPAFGLSCYDCAAPVFSGNYSQIYTVVMSTDSGCMGTSTVNVTVVPKYDVFIPNVFTPNGDGVNDEWQIFGNMTGIKQLNVAVFNRWGEKVFESNDINFGWNGTYQGEFAPPAVYTYTAKFIWLNNHADNNYKGTITLIR